MHFKTVCLTVCFVLATAVSFAETVYYVDPVSGSDAWDGTCAVWDGQTSGPKATIKGGLSVCGHRETVLLADGVYTGADNKEIPLENLIRNIKSANGPENCIIDLESDGWAFWFKDVASAGSVIEGVTIRNGLTTAKGAVRNSHDGRIDVKNCVFENCRADIGGAITVDGNVVASDCLFEGCFAIDGGGAIGVDGFGSLCAERCTFVQCASNNRGGAVGFASSSSVFCSLTSCVFKGNHADEGQAVYISGTDAELTHCIFEKNYDGVPDQMPGAVYFGWNTNAHVIGCAFLEEELAVESYWCDTLVQQCTFRGSGGLAINSDSATVTVEDSIIWGYETAIDTWYPEDITVRYSVIQGGWDGEENIDLDPLFSNHVPYAILPGSPCVDRGIPSPTLPLLPEDICGNPRVLDGDTDGMSVVDIGAYELDLDQPIACVSERTLDLRWSIDGDPFVYPITVTNGGSGTLPWTAVPDCDWISASPGSGESAGEADTIELTIDVSGLSLGEHEGAVYVGDQTSGIGTEKVVVRLFLYQERRVPSVYPTIQDALDASIDGDTIVLADGIYTGQGNKNLVSYGKQLVIRSANGPEHCTVDCELDGRAFNLTESTEAVFTIEGIRFVNGDATTIGGSSGCGGAIYMACPSVIRNCVFEDNNAITGGAVCCRNRLLYEDCVSFGNTASGSGGAVFSGGETKIVGSQFEQNKADYGGAICFGNGSIMDLSPPEIVNCTIVFNEAETGGGVATGNGVTMSECVVSDNKAWFAGGAFIESRQFAVRIVNSTFERNWVKSDGGAIKFDFVLRGYEIIGCRFAGNTVRQMYGGAIYAEDEGRIVDCFFLDNFAYNGGGCYANGSTIENCVFDSNKGASSVAIYGTGNDITHCTFIRNEPYPDLYTLGGNEITVTNSILWDHENEVFGTVTITHSCVRGGYEGEGNIDADPQFTYGAWLSPTSPCVDALETTTVATDFCGIARPQDGNGDGITLADMGAYELVPPTLGDANCDGVVDSFDINPFVSALVATDEYNVANPACNPANADCNGDGVIDVFDIDPFVQILVGN